MYKHNLHLVKYTSSKLGMNDIGNHISIKFDYFDEFNYILKEEETFGYNGMWTISTS